MNLVHEMKLKRNLSIPLYEQIYGHLRRAILTGQLNRGSKLPSTGALADELSVSRNTILNAYDQLAAEGCLERLPGKGTFITQLLPEDRGFCIYQQKRSIQRLLLDF